MKIQTKGPSKEKKGEKEPRMLCPTCLRKVYFIKEEKGINLFYRCSECKGEVPRLYVEEYKEYPPIVIGAVGFRGIAGKTTFFSSLFYTLFSGRLTTQWPDFYALCLNEASLDTVHKNIEKFRKGEKFEATPEVLLEPTLLRLYRIPRLPRRTLVICDIGGEAFETPARLQSRANFVARASVVLFLVCPVEVADDLALYKLLNTYIVGVRQLGETTKRQRLLVVYTKGDRVHELYREGMGFPEEVFSYLRADWINEIGNIRRYCRNMKRISKKLKKYTRDFLLGQQFLNLAKHNFKSVDFCIVSALGGDFAEQHTPKERDLRGQATMGFRPTPKRILDPLFFILKYARP